MIFQQGIYYMDSVAVPVGETWEGIGRVIITRADGRPPSIENHGAFKNIMAGGMRETSKAGCAQVYPFDNSLWDGVTLFGYWGGINGGSHVSWKVKNSRFVNCGGHQHSEGEFSILTHLV